MEVRRKLSDYRAPIYTPNYKYFEQWCGNHRSHQNLALHKIEIDHISGIDIGQVISPCGTGKTRIQISLHVKDMIQNTNGGIYVIASHRLSLNSQLLKDLLDVVIHCGLPIDVLYIGSYQSALDQYYTKYHRFGYGSKVSRHLASTNQQDIEQFLAEAKRLRRHVVIASTYDSIFLLKNIAEINVATFDEAHNTIQKDFTKNITQVKDNILRQYFFTATPKVKGEVGGMNDQSFYGNVLVDVPPKEMLDCGEIVMPRLHLIDSENGETTNSTNKNMLVKNTIEAFIKHRYLLKEHSSAPEEVGAKLLIGCNSIDEMREIYDALISETMANDMQMFAISSDGCYVNWESVSKEKFFTKLMLLTDAEDALIFNVDMLTEGIDLPSITGVMPLRNLGLAKLIQLIGRALRLHTIDRARLYAGNLDISNRVKPFGYLVMPRHLATVSQHEQMVEIAKIFYSYWGTMPEQVVIQEKYTKLEKKTLPSMIPYQYQTGIDYDLGHQEMSLIDATSLSMFKDDILECKTYPQKKKYFERMIDEALIDS